MNENLIYAYCLINHHPKLPKVAETLNLKLLNYGHLHAVVKYVSEKGFSEENFKKNLSDLDWLNTNAREHVDVIYQIMENNTVIPFKFGTIFQIETSLEKFISDYYASLD